LRGWGDLEAEGSRAAPEGIDAALTLLFFVMLLLSFIESGTKQARSHAKQIHC
jgi:hypothetical protein